MTIFWIPSKIVHSDPLPSLQTLPYLDEHLSTYYQTYKKDKENRLPFSIRFTHRLHNEKDIAISSIICECGGLFKFEKEETPNIEEMDRFLENCLLQLEIHWEDKTRQTALFGNTIKGFTKEKKDKIIKDIIESAKDEGLL